MMCDEGLGNNTGKHTTESYSTALCENEVLQLP